MEQESYHRQGYTEHLSVYLAAETETFQNSSWQIIKHFLSLEPVALLHDLTFCALVIGLQRERGKDYGKVFEGTVDADAFAHL